MWRIYKKYEEIVNYLIVGFLTTLVSLSSYFVFVHTIFNAQNPFEIQLANIFSWILAVLFAYITNRVFVFKSESKNYKKEMISFFSSRVITLLMDMFIMFLCVTVFSWYDLLGKLISQVVVTIGNYLFSKIIVFKSKHSA